MPRRAVLLGTVAGCGAVAAQAVSPGRTFPFLLNSTGAVLIIMYLTLLVIAAFAVVLVACALTKGRRRAAELRFVNTVR
ncbi:hypothetical protein ABT237_25430 [Streptomyces sp. NPDC001581]|uniref:hypothetical protein n=1 Tax=Streptomyces sp. NPDC001581 TaxID=3154386 RepID=UPI003320D9BC